MKICTWNMRRSRAAWEWIEHDLDPDIALLQEVVAPPIALNGTVLWQPIGGSRRWGSAIYVKRVPVEHLPLDTYHGWVIAARIRLAPTILLTTLSLHAQIIHSYSITTLHHIFSDLTVLLAHSRYKLVGGDFNAGLLWDKEYNTTTHKILFDRVEAFGLSNCHRRFHEQEVQTFRNKRGKPWQLDHLFISYRLANKLTSCDVIDRESLYTFSDHNPIVATLEVDNAKP